MPSRVALGVYRHFKGNHYQVIDTVCHSETEEWLVLYKPLYGEGDLWVRPVTLFLDKKYHNGVEVPRFEWLNEGEDVSA